MTNERHVFGILIMCILLSDFRLRICHLTIVYAGTNDFEVAI